MNTGFSLNIMYHLLASKQKLPSKESSIFSAEFGQYYLQGAVTVLKVKMLFKFPSLCGM